MPKLTKRVVEAAEPKATDYWVWCSELKGFGVRVRSSGRRTYHVDYRSETGDRRRPAVGVHGKVTCEEARKLAMALLGDVARGKDPAAEKLERRRAMTVSQLADAYLLAAEKGLILGRKGLPKKTTTLDTDRGRVERHIKPLLGRKAVKDITSGDVARFIRDVTSGKTAVAAKPSGKLRGVILVTGGAGTAARTAGLLGAMLSFAVQEGVITINPANGVRRPAVNARDRRLDAEELLRLGAVLRADDDAGVEERSADAIWLLALTGARRSEITNLRWEEVDLDGSCLRLADTKTGRSIRPLGAPAVDRLRAIRDRVDGEFVVPAPRGKAGFRGLPDAWHRIVQVRAGLPDITAHVLRHTFASVAADMGISEATIGAMLGHAKSTVTSRYTHHLDEVLVAAADRTANAVFGMMTGERGAVVEMPKRVRT